MIEENCEGCYRKRVNSCALLCQNPHVNKPQNTDKKPRNCPCMICLIKGVCAEACEDRDIYWAVEYDRLYKEESSWSRYDEL